MVCVRIRVTVELWVWWYGVVVVGCGVTLSYSCGASAASALRHYVGANLASALVRLYVGTTSYYVGSSRYCVSSMSRYVGASWHVGTTSALAATRVELEAVIVHLR